MFRVYHSRFPGPKPPSGEKWIQRRRRSYERWLVRVPLRDEKTGEIFHAVCDMPSTSPLRCAVRARKIIEEAAGLGMLADVPAVGRLVARIKEEFKRTARPTREEEFRRKVVSWEPRGSVAFVRAECGHEFQRNGSAKPIKTCFCPRCLAAAAENEK